MPVTFPCAHDLSSMLVAILIVTDFYYYTLLQVKNTLELNLI
ncbi:hypothetical protein DDI_0628 [Dickeya dianthicola RNS04.9]|nr:hypothetical protein DDI_0628 [Dickeya dianthicola RNS04.9]